MTKPPKTKKKRSFFSILLAVFLSVVLLATLVIFLQPKFVTQHVLSLYTQRLVVVMTSEKYYDIESDQEYVKDLESKQKTPGFNKQNLADDILAKRRGEITEAFQKALSSYENSPETNHFYESFVAIRKHIEKMFSDQKIFANEFQELISLLNKIGEYSEEKG